MDVNLQRLVDFVKTAFIKGEYTPQVKKQYNTATGKLEKIVLEVDAIVSHKSPPKGYPKNKSQYGDPKNYKYPLSDEKKVRAAWSYINMPKNQKGYSPSELAAIKARIKRAGKKYGIEFND